MDVRYKFASFMIVVTGAALFSQCVLAQGTSGKAQSLNPNLIDKIKPPHHAET